MEVTKTIKTLDGAEFTAALKDKEVDFLLEYAINSLIARGVMPFSVVPAEELIDYPPASQSSQ